MRTREINGAGSDRPKHPGITQDPPAKSARSECQKTRSCRRTTEKTQDGRVIKRQHSWCEALKREPFAEQSWSFESSQAPAIPSFGFAQPSLRSASEQ